MKKKMPYIRSFFRIFRQIFVNGLLRQGYRQKIPTSIIIEPTNACNLKCSCCPQGNVLQAGRTKGFMSRTTFLEILKNIDVPLKEISLYLHGEPFLNKDLDFFAAQIDKMKNTLTTIYSNGYNIDMELLQKVLKYKKVRFSFSMDIATQEIYENIRFPAKYSNAIDFLSVINNVFAENNRKYELTMIADKNIDEQQLSEQLFSQYSQLKKISFGTKFPWPEHFYTGNLENNISKKRKLCNQIINGISVFWTGEVSMCSYDYSGKLIIGDLTKQALSEIYNSQQARKIRKKHFFYQCNKISICKNCILPRFNSKTTVFNHTKK
ncbi:MAG: radical SAM protein [Prevotellaceae bacterium]|jgi:radical SAM protein with 4Fe4S-binding SPASM domain|nr:radical SAM protein [Prevotellaceae bacterium]